MLDWSIIFAAASGLILFLFGMEQFSREIQKVAGERFRSFLAGATKNTLRGTVLGAVVTAVVQSSTMVSIITIGLVDSGLISFMQSLSILLGAGVGTTITAQLVAFNFTAAGPIFIPIGFLLSIVGGRFAFIGKPIFYFGLVFFGISMVSQAMMPLREDPAVISYVAGLSSIPLAILAGFILTNLFQSSSILTGLVVILVGNGFITIEHAIPLIMGANIGTVTPLIASANMGLFARRSAVAHAFFNFASVIIILPFIPQFTSFIVAIGGTPAHQAANAHTVFNILFAAAFLLALRPITALVERIVPGKEEEILFRTVALDETLPAENEVAFGQVEKELNHLLSRSQCALADSETLFSEPDGRVFQRILKHESLSDYLDDRVGRALRELSQRHLSGAEASRTVLLLRMSNALEQINDTVAGLAYVAESVKGRGNAMSPEARSDISQIYIRVREDLALLSKEFPAISDNTVVCMRQNESLMRKRVNLAYSNHLERLQQRKAYAANSFVKAISRLDSVHAKVREIRKLCEIYNGREAQSPP